MNGIHAPIKTNVKIISLTYVKHIPVDSNISNTKVLACKVDFKLIYFNIAKFHNSIEHYLLKRVKLYYLSIQLICQVLRSLHISGLKKIKLKIKKIGGED